LLGHEAVNFLQHLPREGKDKFFPAFLQAVLRLSRIPKNDASRSHGFQVVTDWLNSRVKRVDYDF